MQENSETQQFIEKLLKSNSGKALNIVILTGAGISVESGLKTFRGEGGLWCGERVENVATPQAFVRDPALVHKFYNERRNELDREDVAPNAAHKALAELQQNWSGDVTIVTQNIDNLHESGGSGDVIHMHGEVCKSFCISCYKKIEQKGDSFIDDVCPRCNKKGGMRPDIVWFGEMPYHMDRIEMKLAASDLFISVGTSGNVYPAAGFVLMANNAGAQTLEINLEPSMNAQAFSHGMYEPASQEVPRFVETLFETQKEKSGTKI